MKLLKYAGIFLLSAILVYVGATYLKAVWPILLIVAVVVIASVITFRVWRNRPRW